MCSPSLSFSQHPTTQSGEYCPLLDEVVLYDAYARYPWRSPGSAKIYSSCGVLGGNPLGCGGGDGTGLFADTAPFNTCAGGGFEYGPCKSSFTLTTTLFIPPIACHSFAKHLCVSCTTSIRIAAETLHFPNKTNSVWPRGSEQEVSWNIAGIRQLSAISLSLFLSVYLRAILSHFLTIQ